MRRWLPRLKAVWRRGHLAAKGDPQRAAAIQVLAAGLLAALLAALRVGRRLVVPQIAVERWLLGPFAAGESSPDGTA